MYNIVTKKTGCIFFHKEINITGRESRVVVLVSEGCHNKVQKSGWLNTTQFFHVTVLESRSLKSKCYEGQAISQMSQGGGFIPCIFLLMEMPGVFGVSV